MKIHVKYFASVRDMMGKDSEVIDIDTNLTVFGLWETLTLNLKSDMKVMYEHSLLGKLF